MIYLLTVNGTDRIGLVEALAEHIQKSGGNWLESRLCRLGGQFAGIVRLEFNAPPAELADTIATLSCKWVALSGEEAVPEDGGIRVRINITAADRPGLVKQITHLITSSEANIEEVESRVFSAPFSGERMFEAHYQIQISSSQAQELLAAQLESLAEELMCDIQLGQNLATL